MGRSKVFPTFHRVYLDTLEVTVLGPVREEGVDSTSSRVGVEKAHLVPYRSLVSVLPPPHPSTTNSVAGRVVVSQW